MYLIKVREWLESGDYQDYPIQYYSDSEAIKAFRDADKLAEETGKHYYVVFKD